MYVVSVTNVLEEMMQPISESAQGSTALKMAPAGSTAMRTYLPMTKSPRKEVKTT